MTKPAGSSNGRFGTAPLRRIANPFGDLGNILELSPAAPGAYSIVDDCSGTLQFFDPSNPTFKIYVEPPRGDTIWMIQTHPANNVFQGSAERVW